MIFSAFAILNFTTTAEKSKQTIINPSVPVVSYSQFGETVSFIGSQPVISFGLTEYPVSWQIMSITQPSHLSANPLHATGNNSNSTPYLSAAQFNSYTTSRINNSAQNSANLIQYSNSIQAASVFFFHNYTMSSSLAFKNLLNHSVAYMVDFTMILPETGSFTEGGAGSKNVKMNNGSGIINPSCYDIQIGGVNINWQSESSLFHGGIITQKYNHDILAAPMGPVTLAPNETYTIDPQIEPAPQAISGGGGIHKNSGGGGGSCGSSPSTTYPPDLTDVSVTNHGACVQNSTVNSTVNFHYCVSSTVGSTPLKLKFLEVEDSGQAIVLGTKCMYAADSCTISFNANNIGCFKGYEICYWNPNSHVWGISNNISQPFDEYANTHFGYAFPSQDNMSSNFLLKDNGNIIATIGQEVAPDGSFLRSGTGTDTYFDYGVFSKNNTYMPRAKSITIKFIGNNRIADQSLPTYLEENSYCQNYQSDSISTIYKEAVSLMVDAASLALSILTASAIGILLAGTSLALCLYHTGCSSNKYTGTYSCSITEPSYSGTLGKCSGPVVCFYHGFTQGESNCSSIFSEHLSIKTNSFGSYCGEYGIEHFSFTSGFTVFNKTLNQEGNGLPPTYSGSATSQIYLREKEAP
ncbi:MAG: hypothetical protein M1498_02125 [Candidatus Thermoplasmatota archaeon]|nr:hypothetical protein [Candidatus Thermoplasmatota archaeon]